MNWPVNTRKHTKRAAMTTAQVKACVESFKQTGDARHLDQFIEGNMGLVVRCANAFKGYRVAFDDLVQAGSLGLTHGVRKFDPDKGFAPTTYLVWWIRAAMWKEILHAASVVRFGTTERDKANFTRLSKRKLGQGDAEFAAQLGISVEELQAGDERMRSLVVYSLDAPSFSQEGSPEPWLNTFASSDPGAEALCMRREAEASVREALEKLSPRQRFVIGMRTWHGATLRQVGLKLGVSRERARQIQAGAMEKLRAIL